MPLSLSPSATCRSEGCTLTGALSVTTSVRNGVSIVHGPAGCAHHNFSLLHAIGLDRDHAAVPRLASSGMLEADVVFGGEDALRTAIRAAVSQDPDIVFVLSTCVAEAIGDDAAAVCAEGWQVPVVPVPAGGFLGGSFQNGVTNALTALAGLAPAAPGPDDPRTGVNIIGEKNLEYEVEEHHAEIVRLLALLGLEVNIRFVRQISIRDLAALGRASFNVLRDEGAATVGRELALRFGTPAVPSFPAGLSGTIAFLEQAGEACGIDPCEAVAREQDAQQAVLSAFSDLGGACISLQGIHGADPGPAAVLEIAGCLGMKVQPSGTRVPIPFSPPVGTRGVRRLLHRWRRVLHA